MKNNKKPIRMLMGIMMFVLCITCSIFMKAEEVSAASKPSPTISRLTMYVGDKDYTIKYKNRTNDANITYKSSNQKVATVNKNGVIHPVAKGSTNISITIKQNGQTYKSEIKLTVKVPYVLITNKIKEMEVGETYDFDMKGEGFKNPDYFWWINRAYTGEIDKKTGEFEAQHVGEVSIVAQERATGKKSICKIKIVESTKEATFSVDKKELTITDKGSIMVTLIPTETECSIEIEDQSIVTGGFAGQYGTKKEIILWPKKNGTTNVVITNKETKEKVSVKVTVVGQTLDKVIDARLIIPHNGTMNYYADFAIANYGDNSLFVRKVIFTNGYSTFILNSGANENGDYELTGGNMVTFSAYRSISPVFVFEDYNCDMYLDNNSKAEIQIVYNNKLYRVTVGVKGVISCIEDTDWKGYN